MGLDTYVMTKERNKEGKREDKLYWRKANHIHRWFTEHLYRHDENDNCNPKPFMSAMLDELEGLCRRVLLNPKLGELLLPTSEGFFFGTTDYDNWYFDSLDQTIHDIQELRKSYGDSWRDAEFVFESWY